MVRSPAAHLSSISSNPKTFQFHFRSLSGYQNKQTGVGLQSCLSEIVEYLGRVMENAKNENEVNLGLGLGAGAGANAKSRKKAVVAELVWSTQNGLTIKCAACTTSHCVCTQKQPTSTHAHTDENVGEVKCVHSIEMDKGSKGKEKESMMSSKSIPCVNVTEGTGSQTTADLLPLLANEAEDKTKNVGEGLSLEIGLGVKIQDLASDVEKMEETAENDVILERDECSYEVGMESGSKGKKRWRFEDEEKSVVESKRMKNQSRDSSFMNWISNMVKGVKPRDDRSHEVDDDDHKRLGFQTVFQSLYSSQTTAHKSKELIVFDKTIDNQKAFGNLWIARLSPKPLVSCNNSELKSYSSSGSGSLKPLCEMDVSGGLGRRSCSFCREVGHELSDCLKMKEKDLSLQLNQWGCGCPWSDKKLKHKEFENGNVSIPMPKEMLDTIRRLRLSRADILKWMNSSLPVSSLEGYFLRLRLSKWEGGGGAAGYYVACITDDNPCEGSKKSIRVNVGGVDCFVESLYISNSDFLQDEVRAWWQKMNIRRLPSQYDFTSKLEERKRLGI